MIHDTQEGFRTDTFLPARPRSTDRITRASPSNQSEVCRDDPTYLSPRYSFPCSMYRKISCDNFGFVFTTSQIQELVKRCPKSCNICVTNRPSMHPSIESSEVPTQMPTYVPSNIPTSVPTVTMTLAPTECQDNLSFRDKFGFPCGLYSGTPCGILGGLGRLSERDIFGILLNCKKTCGYCRVSPSALPSKIPSERPTQVSSLTPSTVSSERPSERPIEKPSESPTSFPTGHPSKSPSSLPTVFPSTPPSFFPSAEPSKLPSEIPSDTPSGSTTGFPSSVLTPHPSRIPSKLPSQVPSDTPSESLTDFPSFVPIFHPSRIPSKQPTKDPTEITETPSGHSEHPSILTSAIPSKTISTPPTDFPSLQSSEFPSVIPSKTRSPPPADFPSLQSSEFPSVIRSKTISSPPTDFPSLKSSNIPNALLSISISPSYLPFRLPSQITIDVSTAETSNLRAKIPKELSSKSSSTLLSLNSQKSLLNSPSNFPSLNNKFQLNNKSKSHVTTQFPSPNLALYFDSQNTIDIISTSKSDKESTPVHECEDDQTFRDYYGHSCSYYDSIDCSDVVHIEQVNLPSILLKKCPKMCGRCEINTRAIEKDLFDIDTIDNIALFSGIGGVAFLIFSIVGFITVRKWQSRKEVLDSVNVVGDYSQIMLHHTESELFSNKGTTGAAAGVEEDEVKIMSVRMGHVRSEEKDRAYRLKQMMLVSDMKRHRSAPGLDHTNTSDMKRYRSAPLRKGVRPEEKDRAYRLKQMMLASEMKRHRSAPGLDNTNSSDMKRNRSAPLRKGSAI